MVIGALLSFVLAAPATAGAPAQPDLREFGPLWIERSTTLIWPGLYLPSFTLATDRRRVHRLSLGLDLPVLRGLSFEGAVVEPSDDPDIRARTMHLPTDEGRRAYAWGRVRLRIPNSMWQVGVGRSWVVGAASAVARGAMTGRGAAWRVDLLRPLR